MVYASCVPHWTGNLLLRKPNRTYFTPHRRAQGNGRRLHAGNRAIAPRPALEVPHVFSSCAGDGRIPTASRRPRISRRSSRADSYSPRIRSFNAGLGDSGNRLGIAQEARTVAVVDDSAADPFCTHCGLSFAHLASSRSGPACGLLLSEGTRPTRRPLGGKRTDRRTLH